MIRISRLAAALALIAALLPGTPRAEVAEITVAEQFGVAMLPLMVMQKYGLAEKHAKAAGLPALKVNYQQVAGPSVITDGLISGAVQFAAQGAPSLITLWDRTRSNVGVKGVAAITTYPLYLLTRNPAVQSVRDLSDKDRIAVPSVKISTQAIMLQMLAAGLYGEKEFARLDPLTVSLSHPDAAQAMISGMAGVNAHFSSSPFYEQEIKQPGVRLLTTNYEILGGPATALVLVASQRFHDANPKVFKAFYDGLAEAIAMINADKPAAAQLYLDVSKDTKTSLDEVLRVITDKDYAFTLQPAKVFRTALFMAKIGSIRQAPSNVDEMFFPEVRGLGGD